MRLQRHKIGIEDFELLTLISKGAFGEVRLCVKNTATKQTTINRPERRNAFRPHTIMELIRAFNDARDDSMIGVIILTGKVGGIKDEYTNVDIDEVCEE
ncbi:hypothetical protein L1987_63947 [Smallanthus sonchifolius]|uniref:Uncharacterized protein n=1 Tax=Smallanthus sonchifolius TaxID=185202 RepID=A0ACB9CEP9_9ASTR|nr:hypothetical protein L1987_63947 [Smallanthus sonchifolius]